MLYHIHCKQLNILPIQFRFVYHDLKLFHLMIHNFSCIKLPAYIHVFQVEEDLDSPISDIVTRGQQIDATSKWGFNNSYFTELIWCGIGYLYP